MRNARRVTVWTWISAGTLAVLSAAAWRHPAWVETTYAEDIGPAIGAVLAATWGRLPFGAAEWLVLAVPVVVVIAGLRSLRYIRGLRPSLAEGGFAKLNAYVARAAVVLVAFYPLWGLHYARPALSTRLGWSPAEDGSGADTAWAARASAEPERSDLLLRIASELVTATNVAYLEIHRLSMPMRADSDEDRFDRTTVSHSFPWEANAAQDASIDVGLTRAGQFLALDDGFERPRSPARPVRNSWLLNRLHLAGFYFPWTGEANFNAAMPTWQQPHTIAHEKAHQRGIASEDEANFLGFFGCVLAPKPFIRYSGLLFAQRQLLRELIAIDPDRGNALLAQRNPGVQRDVDAAQEYWRRFDGRAADLQRDVNDRYLRANRVDGGIESYGRSARLILLWARESGGSLPIAP